MPCLHERFNQQESSLLKYNPIHKRIPVFVHNGKPIAESQVILEYIDETWQGYPILPKDPHERAVARSGPSSLTISAWMQHLELCWGADQKEREKAVEEVNEQLRFLEDELKEKRFFGGEEIGFVDIVGNLIAFWLGVFEEASGAKLMPILEFPVLCFRMLYLCCVNV